jgi:hypothetical protein
MSGKEFEEHIDQGILCQVEGLVGRGCHMGE